MSVNNDNGDAEHRMSITKGHGHGHSMVGSAFFSREYAKICLRFVQFDVFFTTHFLLVRVTFGPGTHHTLCMGISSFI